MMQEFFSSSKKQIADFLTSFLEKKKKELSHINPWSQDALNSLLVCATKGKMVRASLVLFGAQIYEKKVSDDVIKAAAAIELFHTALLIHDDIMDQDTLRRGEKTTHACYQDIATKHRFPNPTHFGHSLGICVGDIGFFLGFELVSGLEDTMLSRSIMAIYATELTAVGIAQMQDIYFGSLKKTVTEKETLELYRYKTARYTFSLPLKIGATLASLPPELIAKLEKLGELLGIIFQIKDDELGLFGKEKEIGKTVGSDIREGKKTLYYLALEKSASLDERKKMSKIFGNPDLSTRDIAYIHKLIGQYDIRTQVEKTVAVYVKQAQKLLKNLSVDNRSLMILTELLEYNLQRSK